MNREIVLGGGGAGVYPLTGDVESSAGNPQVVVTGLHNVPIAAASPQPGAGLQYDSTTHSWTPIVRAAIQVNGQTASDDYLITVNVSNPILVNGV